MDTVADLRPEHVVNEPVLGDPAEALERRCGDDGVEVLPVAGNGGGGTGNCGFDPVLKLFGSR